jgi:predicted ATPase
MSRFALQSPFLRQISLRDDEPLPKEHPFDLPFLHPEFSVSFDRPVTVIAGDNGSGKSTLLEAIARHAGFGQMGGSRDHAHAAAGQDGGLASALRFSWLPKVTNGFFFRAESYFGYSQWLDGMVDANPSMEASYGSRRMLKQSHGESFLALFENRFGSQSRAFYVLDEPESALSPQRQFRLLRLFDRWTKSGNVQVIVATHSPILMAYPQARFLHLDGASLAPADYRTVEQFRTLKDFLDDPEAAVRAALTE